MSGQTNRNRARRSGLIVIIVAAVLLELLSAIQYHYTRGLLEKELERNALTELIASTLRMREVMSNAEVSLNDQLWHAENHLGDSAYARRLLYELVREEGDNVVGAFCAFEPGFMTGGGSLFEMYARQSDTVEVEQIASERHDYTRKDFYVRAMRGDTAKWNSPYMDAEGARGMVITYAMPLRDRNRRPVGVLGVDLSTSWISEVVNMHHHYPSSFTLVLDSLGSLIACPPDSLVSRTLTSKIVAMVNDSTVAREKKANGRVTGFPFVDDDRGERGHVYYATKKRAPRWQMVVVCYDREVFGQLDDMRRNILWLGLAALLLLGVIIQLFFRSMRRLQASQLEQERIGSELRIAQDIQTQMLPAADSIVRSDVGVAGSLVLAREVGGDLYDYFLRDEKLFFCIGDVSGKGIPAAMLMAETHSMFRSASAHESNPARILETINESSCRGNESNMFVTFFVAVLDLPTGRLHYANAGHDVPLLAVCSGNVNDNLNDNTQHTTAVNRQPSTVNYHPTAARFVPFEAPPCLPLGVFPDVKYEAHQCVLAPGSIMFLYTDGLTEARNQRRAMFGFEKVKQQLLACLGQPCSSEQPAATARRVVRDMNLAASRFAEGAEPSDDLTLLVVSYTPVKANEVLSESITLRNDPREVTRLSSFVKEVAERLELNSQIAGNVRLAVEEAVVNVMDYAYPSGVEGDVTIEAHSDGELLKFVISDAGAAFDPTKAARVDTSLSAEERPIGGLGIHLVRQLMDSINYERIAGRNILTLRKKYK